MTIYKTNRMHQDLQSQIQNRHVIEFTCPSKLTILFIQCGIENPNTIPKGEQPFIPIYQFINYMNNYLEYLWNVVII